MIMARNLFLSLVAIHAFLFGASVVTEEEYAARRAHLMHEIESDVRATSEYIGKDTLDEKVMDAMAKVRRHKFVPEGQMPYAYENRPLPIGYGQTISQPYIVALMTDLLGVKRGDRVLEIGTGSGYQAAVLAELTRDVYTIEIIPGLGREAKDRLLRLGYSSVKAMVGDGYYGWPSSVQFDGIAVTAAVSHVPPPLLAQLKGGGRMVIPVGSPFLTQQLMLVEKGRDGKVMTRQILPVMFVPLTGEH